MCGIAAVIARTGKARHLQLELLRHRGPDGRGEWTSPDGRIWLGHTRLAIVDLSPSGAQPMEDPETGNVIIFNGEIYNHREIRHALQHRAFQSESDTETLLLAYREWKEGMLSRLRGMFAFLIYDAATETVFGARDRLGIKPLYFAETPESIRMASEIKLLRAPEGESFSPAAFSLYLQRGAFSDALLPFAATRILAAGHSMHIDPNGTMRMDAFWPPPQLPACSTEVPLKKVRALLERSVREHLLADVPVAALLSGGIDSSIVTALAAQALPSTLQTFSVGFEERGFDESSVAAEVAKRYATDHERIVVSEPEVLEMVREAVGLLDLPSVDAINSYVVCKKIGERGIKVALSGLGGDELFGGYPTFRDVPLLRCYTKMPLYLRKLAQFGGETGRRMLEAPTSDVFALASWRRSFWTRAMVVDAGLPLAEEPRVTPPELRDTFAKISWAELTGYMRNMLLRDTDQMSMANSIELRVPFLDHELVEYVLGLPSAEKRKYRGSKGLLVEACRDLLPEAVYRRKKMGFSLPMDQWMRGPLSDFVKEGMEEVIQRQMLSRNVLDRLFARFEARTLHWTRLWSVVVCGHYLRNSDALEPA